jgi:hypothetical protein
MGWPPRITGYRMGEYTTFFPNPIAIDGVSSAAG